MPKLRKFVKGVIPPRTLPEAPARPAAAGRSKRRTRPAAQQSAPPPAQAKQCFISSACQLIECDETGAWLVRRLLTPACVRCKRFLIPGGLPAPGPDLFSADHSQSGRLHRDCLMGIQPLRHSCILQLACFSSLSTGPKLGRRIGQTWRSCFCLPELSVPSNFWGGSQPRRRDGI